MSTGTLGAEEILELAERPIHRLVARIADAIPELGAKRVAGMAAVVLTASTAVLAARTGPVVEEAPPPRSAVTGPGRAVKLGARLDGAGPFVVFTEIARGDALNVLAVSVAGGGPHFLARIPGVAINGVAQGQARGGSVPILTTEPQPDDGAISSVWLVRRNGALAETFVHTRAVVEGIAVAPDDSEMALSLVDSEPTSTAELWLYPFRVGPPQHVSTMQRPDAGDVNARLAPVGWSAGGVVAVPTCDPCPGAYWIGDHVVMPLPALANERIFASDLTDDGSRGAFQSARVGRCQARRTFCLFAPFRLLAGDVLGTSIREIARSARPAFDVVAISPGGSNVSYTTERRDTLGWRPLSGGAERRFRVAGADVTPAGWLDETRQLALVRRTDASGGTRSTIVIVGGSRDPVVLATGGALAVLGWVR